MLLDKEKYQDTLRKASYDDANDVSLIEDDRVKAYLLDGISKETAKEYEIDIPSSCDALCVVKEDFFVIEFKNREKFKGVYYKDIHTIGKNEFEEKFLPMLD